MDSTNGLGFNGRVEAGFHKNDQVGLCQVDPDAAGTRSNQNNCEGGESDGKVGRTYRMLSRNTVVGGSFWNSCNARARFFSDMSPDSVLYWNPCFGSSVFSHSKVDENWENMSVFAANHCGQKVCYADSPLLTAWVGFTSLFQFCKKQVELARERKFAEQVGLLLWAWLGDRLFFVLLTGLGCRVVACICLLGFQSNVATCTGSTQRR